VTGSGIADFTIDNPIINDGNPYKAGISTFTLADATPDISLSRIWKTADTTTYTDFGGVVGEGHSFKLLANDAATVSDNANIKTSTGANKTLTVDVVYEFTHIGGIWYENATV